MPAAPWLLLQYRLPAEPSAGRVYIWRKLQRLGALLWQDAVWVLPNAPHTYEQFQWLTAEIMERGGEATFWEARLIQPDHEQALIGQFSEQAARAYRAILSALKKKKPDLAALSRQYQQAQARDYFASALGQQVRQALIRLRGGEDR